MPPVPPAYRGRLAPSPTGWLHQGHAATFRCAQERARERGGTLILRIEDLDRARCRPEYAEALGEDLRWAGIGWDEGPYRQSERMAWYAEAWRKLAASRLIYPCGCSRRDVGTAGGAPHGGEAIYPGVCRPPERAVPAATGPEGMNWRFRAKAGEEIEFLDGAAGPQCFVVGQDFGDFVVWRKDGVPAYQLAVVVDDAAMAITEVVRGEDLLVSTAQQLLLYWALELVAPSFYHVPLRKDPDGARLAKRAGAESLRAMREGGMPPLV